MQLIPAIDLKAGKCVRLLRGMFEHMTEYDQDPSELAQSYAQAGAPCRARLPAAADRGSPGAAG